MPISMSSLVVGRQYERPELAKLWGFASHHAISRGVVTQTGLPYIVLFVTHKKQKTLTQYRDFIDGDRLHWEGEQNHGSDDRIVRSKYSGDEIHLFYRDRHHSPFTYLGEVVLLGHEIREDGPSRFEFRVLALSPSSRSDPFREVEECANQLKDLERTEREAIIQSRVGQGLFRKSVLALWEGCAVTGIADPRVLIASHVKPWRDSTNEERLDPHNGLALIPNLDALFDAGIITFGLDGRLVASHFVDPRVLEVMGVQNGMRLRKLPQRLKRYLCYHHEYVFKGRVEMASDGNGTGGAW